MEHSSSELEADPVPSPVEERPPASVSSGAQGEKRPASRLAKGVGAALLLAALCYAGGLYHGWVRAQPERVRLESELAQALQAREQAESARQETADLAQHARAAYERRAALYEGFRQCQQALDALDARNFGIAESLLRKAERSLGAFAASQPGLAPVLAQLAEMHVEVARNLAGQREQVAAIVARLNALIEGEQERREPHDMAPQQAPPAP